MAEGFSNMRNLVLLILYHNNFSGNINFLSDNLRYLLWHGYPFTSLPSNFEPYYLVELNMPNCSIQRLWEGRKDLPYLKSMDVSNSKYLTETPKFFWTPKLERLDFTGCTNLTQCIKFKFFASLRLSGCTKLQKTPEFTGASNLEYLDMDGCICLSTVHESIGVLAKLRFLSLRDCIVLAGMPNSINTMTSLVTLDLYGCLKLTTLPLGQKFSPPYMESLIFLDASFCNLHRLPDVIGELRCLERLSLQGNNFTSLPPNFSKLGSLAYLNLAHCHELQTFPRISSQKKRSLVGGYFKIASGSRDHRSGLHVFDCPKLKFTLLDNHEYFSDLLCKWLERLLKEPRHFRCGFDIIVPWNWENIDQPLTYLIPEWFHYQFSGRSVIRIVKSNVDDNWVGFSFCVVFESIARFGDREMGNVHVNQKGRFDHVEENISSSGPKIQLPYNWPLIMPTTAKIPNVFLQPRVRLAWISKSTQGSFWLLICCVSLSNSTNNEVKVLS
ncbi:hypothetical protein P8452_57301 [Trifolium repens]|nr:hypothetical protein P8452_57301 [Trifolium repens]